MPSQATVDYFRKLAQQPERAKEISDAFIRNTCPECMNTGMSDGEFCWACDEGRLLRSQAFRW